jgi:hypothetical protein
MAHLSISTAWDESRRIIRRDGRLLVSVTLALIVLPAAIIGLLAPPLSTEVPPGWVQLVTLIFALIGIVGQIAIIRLALVPSTAVGEAIAHAFRRLLPTFAALVLFAFGLALILMPVFILLAGPDSLDRAAAGAVTPQAAGAVSLVMLLVVLAVARFQLITPVGASEHIGPIAILRRSWELSKGQYWRLLAFILLTLFLVVIFVLYLGQVMGAVLVGMVAGKIAPFSLAALIAGLISGAAQGAFTILISVMIARIYAQLAAPAASVPHSGRD